jgi:hypothetical protein
MYVLCYFTHQRAYLVFNVHLFHCLKESIGIGFGESFVQARAAAKGNTQPLDVRCTKTPIQYLIGTD